MSSRSSDCWDPDLYRQHADERLRPGFALMEQIGALPEGDLVDLGCGGGEHLAALAGRHPQRAAIGIDASLAMLAKARALAPQLDWRAADIAEWVPARPPALIFSNAALQWLEDHGPLLRRFFAMLAPDGVLAVQMPANAGSAAHEIARALCRERGWTAEEAAMRSGVTVQPAEFYFDTLAWAGAADINLWETTYHHVLGPSGVAGWMQGAALRPVLAGRDAAEAQAYLADFDARTRAAYPPHASGRTLFAQRRLFLVARAQA